MTNFLDSGKALNIAPFRPDSEHQSDNASLADGLFFSNSSDMVTSENPDKEYNYYDGDSSDELPEEVEDEELSTSETVDAVTISGSGLSPHESDRRENQQIISSRSSRARNHQMADEGDDDSVRLMQEILEEAYTPQDDKDSGSNKLLEMEKHERRALKKDRKQQKQGTKEQRQRSKLERKEQKRSHKKIRPMELKPEDIQRVIGNRKRTIASFDSVESILVSGVPIHLYDLKSKTRVTLGCIDLGCRKRGHSEYHEPPLTFSKLGTICRPCTICPSK